MALIPYVQPIQARLEVPENLPSTGFGQQELHVWERSIHVGT